MPLSSLLVVGLLCLVDGSPLNSGFATGSCCGAYWKANDARSYLTGPSSTYSSDNLGQSNSIRTNLLRWVTSEGPFRLTHWLHSSTEIDTTPDCGERWDYVEVFYDDRQDSNFQPSVWGCGGGAHEYLTPQFLFGAGEHQLDWLFRRDTLEGGGFNAIFVDELQLHYWPDGMDLSVEGGAALTWFGNSGWVPWASPLCYSGDYCSKTAEHDPDTTQVIKVISPGQYTVSFYWRVSSQESVDKLTVRKNSVQQGAFLSGETAWALKSVDVSAGDELEWRYWKDSSTNANDDAGFLDEMTWTLRYECSTGPGATECATCASPLTQDDECATCNSGSALTAGTCADTIKPTVVLSAVGPTTGSTVTIRFSWSEPVSNFDATDITCSAGMTAAPVTGAGQFYESVLTPTQAGQVSVSVGANVCQDLASSPNPNTASTAFTWTYDGESPDVTSLTVTSTGGNPTNTAVDIYVVFSEGVYGFDPLEMVVSNCAVPASWASATLTSYSVSCAPIADGTVTVQVPASVCTDAASNTNTASGQVSILYDATKPVADMHHLSPILDPLSVIVTFNEVLDTPLTPAALTPSAGTTVDSVTAQPGNQYLVKLTPPESNIDLSLAIEAGGVQDVAGNVNEAAVWSIYYTYVKHCTPARCDSLGLNGLRPNLEVCACDSSCSAIGDCCDVDFDYATSCGSSTCSDSVKNGVEEGVDCGGPCAACDWCALTPNTQTDGYFTATGDDYLTSVGAGGTALDLSAQAFSICLWARRASVGTADPIFRQGPGDSTSLVIGWGSDNKLYAQWDGVQLKASAAVTDTDWHHICMTFSTAPNVRNLYMDGAVVAPNDGPGPYIGANKDTYIGWDNTDKFVGALDEVRVYDRELTSQEVSNLGSNQIPADAPVVWIQFRSSDWVGSILNTAGAFKLKVGQVTLSTHARVTGYPVWSNADADNSLDAGTHPLQLGPSIGCFNGLTQWTRYRTTYAQASWMGIKMELQDVSTLTGVALRVDSIDYDAAVGYCGIGISTSMTDSGYVEQSTQLPSNYMYGTFNGVANSKCYNGANSVIDSPGQAPGFVFNEWNEHLLATPIAAGWVWIKMGYSDQAGGAAVSFHSVRVLTVPLQDTLSPILLPKDAPVCLPCETGAGPTDCATCSLTACLTCNPGNYNNEGSCTPCQSSCAPGQAISAPCDGTETSDRQCVAQPCPPNTNGANVPAGCSCKPGYSGGPIVATSSSPYYTGTCNNVQCPLNSRQVGNWVGEGCPCDAGFQGSIVPTSSDPWYSGTCTAVDCPPNSNGPDLPSGCDCDGGFTGTITATAVPPDYYTGECLSSSCAGGTMPTDGFLVFDGANDYLATAADATIPLTDMSVCAWLRRDSVGGSQVFYAYGPSGASTQRVDIGFESDRFVIDLNAGARFDSAATYTDQAWHHWCALISGTGRSIFMDGAVVADNGAVGVAHAPDANLLTYLGGDPVVSKYFLGAVDEVYVYSTVLAGARVTDLFNNKYTQANLVICVPARTPDDWRSSWARLVANPDGAVGGEVPLDFNAFFMNPAGMSTINPPCLNCRRGDATNACATCTAPSGDCDTCNAGSFLDTSVCTTCISSCSPGFAISAACDGTGTTQRSCSAVGCPTDSTGASVPNGCTCDAGFSGAVTATSTAPNYYDSTCSRVSCPAGSSGTDVPSGCNCLAGYSGSITATQSSPYYSGACTAVPCSSITQTYGTTVPNTCTCNPGYTGNIVGTTTGPSYYTGSCAPCATGNCQSFSAQCACGTCNPGYSVDAGSCVNCGLANCNVYSAGCACSGCSAGYYVNGAKTCQAVDCPANSEGPNVPSSCTCKAGYAGTIQASTTSPYYTGSCVAQPCPEYSTGTSIASGCTCNAGYAGTITPSTSPPYHTGACSACTNPDCASYSTLCNCNQCTAGHTLDTGSCVDCSVNKCTAYTTGNCQCSTCLAGYSPAGGTCTAVACPAQSAGTNVPTADCVCNAGYTGSIQSSTIAPYYTGSCSSCAMPACVSFSSGCTCGTCAAGYYKNAGGCTECRSSCAPGYALGTSCSGSTSSDRQCTAIPCSNVLNAQGTFVHAGCTCAAGFTGSITATSAPPYYSSSCSEVACPVKSSGTGVASGCTCIGGTSGTITATSSDPYYSGSCVDCTGPPFCTGWTGDACFCSSCVAGKEPLVDGTCGDVDCPAQSTGTSVTAGCTCSPAGYSGTVSGSTVSPYYVNTCSPCGKANCLGYSGSSGCNCNVCAAGYYVFDGGCSICRSSCDPGYQISAACAGTETSNRVCTPVGCPAKSSGPSVPSGCVCNAGHSGSITASSTTPYYTGTCTPVPCTSVANSAGTDVPSTCTCIAGFSGVITPTSSTPYYSGSCGACGVANCNGYSSGCTCNSCAGGYTPNGGVCDAAACTTTVQSSPKTSGSCGASLSSGATCQYSCEAGFFVTGTTTVSCDAGTLMDPTYSCGADGCTVPAQTAPKNSGVCGDTLSSGSSCQLSCDAGYSPDASSMATCAPYAQDPFNCVSCNKPFCNAYSNLCVCSSCDNGYQVSGGSCVACGVAQCTAYGAACACTSCNAGWKPNGGFCAPVSCPTNSGGSNVAAGCTCNPGFSGSVTPTTSDPYYTNTCVACAGTNCAVFSSGCSCSFCNSGFYVATGSCNTCRTSCPAGYAISAPCGGSETSDRTCTAVACPAQSFGDNVPTGCTCNAGYQGTITATSTSPFYSGACSPVGCPVRSTGPDIPTGCGCDTGYSGTIAAIVGTPYYSGVCAACTVSQCTAYSTGCECSACNSGFSQGGGVCSACNAAQCSSYSAGCACDGCTSGWYVPDGQSTCAVCTTANCATYGVECQCTKCDPGWLASGGACVPCASAECNDYINAVDTCECNACNSGYVVNSGACVGCNKARCTDYGTGCTCIECEAGWTVSGGNCVDCSVSQCVNYSPGVCQCDSCAAGYVVNAAACDSCGEPTCSSFSSGCTCNACGAGYYIAAGDCVVCKTTCPVGQQLSGSCTGVQASDTTVCSDCSVPQCTEYSSGCFCSACAPSFAPSAGSCASCNKAGCVSYSTGCTCDACGVGYYLSGGSCTACKTSCPTGKYLSGLCDGVGTSDATTCESCTVQQCQAYHPPAAGQCKCSDCNPGYVANSGSCQACTIAACQVYLSGCTCQTCSSGHFVQTGGCTACRTACTPGQQLDGSCNGGGTTDTTTCSACNVPRCTGYSSGCTCSTCEPGYFASGGVCQGDLCDVTAQSSPQTQGTCVSAQLQSGSSCAYSCESGYFAVGSSTVSCEAGVLTEPAGFSCSANGCATTAQTTPKNMGTCGPTLSSFSGCNYGCVAGYKPVNDTQAYCSAGNLADPTYWCDVCNVANCQGYEDSAVANSNYNCKCSQCVPGFQPVLGACQECNSANCTTYATGCTCDSCTAGYTVSNGACVQCSVTSCTGYSSECNCNQCQAGSYVSSNVCATCKTSCAAGFFLQGSCSGSGTTDTTTCASCAKTNCVAYSASGTCFCSACSAGYIASGGSCVPCLVPNCADSYSEGCQCAVCDIGYYQNGGSCIECRTTCAAGSTLSGSCPGSGTADTTVCNECTNGCAEYGSANSCECSGCPRGQYVDSGTCVDCPALGCVIYSSACECGLCSPGQWIDGGACDACRAPGDCPTGQQVSGSCNGASTTDTTTCEACTTANCATWAAGAGCQCSVCDTGYTVDNGNCVSCDVSFCESYSSGCTCDECEPAYFIDNGACTACLSTCPIGKQLTGICNGTTTSDPRTCETCTTPHCVGYSSGCACGACDTGYSPQNGGCVNCTTANCVSYSAGCDCDGCEADYFVSSQACAPCKSSCPAGKFLNGACTGTEGSDITTCDSCTTPRCDQYSSGCNCTHCTTGYVANGVDCDVCPDSNCIAWASGDCQCSQCLPNYYIVFGGCAACASSCPTGQQLSGSCSGSGTQDDTNCLPCGVPQCASYSSGCTCDTCDPGYTQSGGTCSADDCSLAVSMAGLVVPQNVGDCVDPLASGSNCNYGCDTNYYASGSTRVSCAAGTLDDASFSCTGSGCSVPQPAAPKTRGDCGSSLADGTSCSYGCASGYTPSGDRVATCSGGGLFTAPSYVCNPNACDVDPQSLPKTLGTCSSTLDSGSECTLNCAEGYQPTTTALTQCNAGQLTSAAYSCEGQYCTLPTMSSPKSLGSCNQTVAHADSCVLGCAAGYSTSDGTLISCFAGDAVMPSYTCTGNPCPVSASASPATNGDCSANLNHGDVCTLSCVYGYTPSGPTQASCNLGTLNKPAYTCTPNACNVPSLSLPKLRGTCGDTLNSGAVCEYACAGGTEKSQPDTTVSCESGVLVQPSYVCNPQPCTVSGRTPPQTLGDCPTELNSGSSCRFGCQTGYKVQNGVSTQITCSSGSLTEANYNCVDINACLNHGCDVNAQCTDGPPPKVDSPGGRTCTCNAGYSGTGEVGQCSNINACINNPCDSRATCQDKPPPAQDTSLGRTCTCNAGYEGYGELGQCSDINACVNHVCDVNAQCTDRLPPAGDTPSGRICQCNPGFGGTGLPNECVDHDACFSFRCDSHADCVDHPAQPNSTSGRTCTCHTGFQGQGEPGQCRDIDSCATTPCDDNAWCEDIEAHADGVDGRNCTCKNGFSGTGEQNDCTDINACVNHPCDTFATCVDLAAPAYSGDADGRVCACEEGYEGSGEVGNCTDSNACLTFPCDPAANCTDHVPPAPDSKFGRQCVCWEGYSGTGEIGNCVDIVACKDFPCDTNAACVDNKAPAPLSPDGRKCFCNNGYRGNGEIGNCSSIDACINNPCDSNASCTDKDPPGLDQKTGRTCRCDAGYQGTGEPGACTDIDACARYPCDTNADCTDEPPPAGLAANGRSCQCHPGYQGSGTPGQCFNINACLHYQCDRNAQCQDLLPPALDEPAGRACPCNPGYQGSGEINECEDINACAAHRCDDNATCTDKAPPAGGAPNDRVCACTVGFQGSGQPGDCSNVNACLSVPCDGSASCTDLPPPAPNSKAGRTCACNTGFMGLGEPSQCVKVNMVPDSVKPSFQAAMSTEKNIVLVDSNFGGQKVSFEVDVEGQGLGLGGSLRLLKVRFRSLTWRPASGAVLWLECSESTPSEISQTGTFVVVCTLPEGAGTNLGFALDWEYLFQSVSVVTGTVDIADLYPAGVPLPTTGPQVANLFAYPPPIITDKTLRRVLDNTVPDGVAWALSPAAVDVQFLGQHFARNNDMLSVTYGPAGTEQKYPCAIVAGSSLTKVLCKTFEGAEGQELRFRLEVAGQVAVSNDWLNYPIQPQLFRVEGCRGQDGNRTTGCPTAGNVKLTVLGADFLVRSTVFVAGKKCVDQTLVSSEEIHCTLPVGAGRNPEVVVALFGLSVARDLLAYADPLITKISGGTDCYNEAYQDLHPSDLQLVNCSRSGGGAMTIQGSDFGQSSATILISTLSCENVRHLAGVAGHSTLMCDLPPGTQLAQPMILIVQGGERTRQAVQVSYRQCMPGQYENPELVCEDCSPGKFTPCISCDANGVPTTQVQSRRICVDCAPGTFGNGTGDMACVPCLAGRAQHVPGRSRCEACAPGKFAPSEAEALCQDCEAGFFAKDAGTITCSRCEPGTVAPAEGTPECTACAKGTQSGNSVTQCTECFLGTFANDSGVGDCLPCRAGQFAPELGMALCTDCPTGSFSGEGAQDCVPCAAAAIAPKAGSSQCQECPEGVIADKFRVVCMCKVGEYGQTHELDQTFRCHKCPKGAVCNSKGVTWEQLETVTGWWRSSNNTLDFYRCLYNTHCPGGLEGKCSPHAIGPLCALCEPNYQRPTGQAMGDCEVCPDTVVSSITITLVGLAMIGVMVLTYYMLIRSDRKIRIDSTDINKDANPDRWNGPDESINSSVFGAPATGNAWGGSRRDITEGSSSLVIDGSGSARSVNNNSVVTNEMIKSAWYTKHANKQGKISKLDNIYTYQAKILISFFQILSAMTTISSVRWPFYFEMFLSYLDFINLKFIPWESMACVQGSFNYFQRLQILTITPLLLFPLIAVFYLLPNYIIAKRDLSDSQRRSTTLSRHRLHFIKLCLFTIFLVYPKCSKSVLGYFDCIKVEDKWYLHTDFSITCHEGIWNDYAIYVAAMIAVYPVGVPIMFGFLLFKARNDLQRPRKLLSVGFLYGAFTYKAYYFELLDMAHKLWLTALLQFFSLEWQLPVAMIGAITYLNLILIFMPYVRKREDRLHFMVQNALFLLLLNAYLISTRYPDGLDLVADAIVSLVLMALFLSVVVSFSLSLLKSLRYLYSNWKRARIMKKFLENSRSRSNLNLSATEVALAPLEADNSARRTGADDLWNDNLDVDASVLAEADY